MIQIVPPFSLGHGIECNIHVTFCLFLFSEPLIVIVYIRLRKRQEIEGGEPGMK